MTAAPIAWKVKSAFMRFSKIIQFDHPHPKQTGIPLHMRMRSAPPDPAYAGPYSSRTIGPERKVITTATTIASVTKTL